MAKTMKAAIVEKPNVITIKQLEAFLWSAELGGMEEASVRLNTSQSAVSKRVQELDLAGFMLDAAQRQEGETRAAVMQDRAAVESDPEVSARKNATTPSPAWLPTMPPASTTHSSAARARRRTSW